MPDSPDGPITFVVPGYEAGAARGAGGLPGVGELAPGQVKRSIKVSARRGVGNEVRVSTVPGEEAVVLHLAGGPSLTLHPEHARDLILAQSGNRDGGTRGAQAEASQEVRVPADLQWRGLEQTGAVSRGFLGRVLLSAFEVVALNKAADFTAEKVAEKVDGQVVPGVYQLDPTDLPRLKGTPRLDQVPSAEKPLLVLVHGTFSTTQGTFSKLWSEHPQRVRSLFQHYGGRVYALDHPTLGASPIENALTLAKALPANARLHLVTHSRGGLVAEVLARVCGNPGDSFKPFEKDGYQKQRDGLRELADLVRSKEIGVDRIVRVACPARGTLLASKRLDAYVSVLKWTLELASLPVVPEILEFLAAVAKRRADLKILPGLAAQIPDSPLVQWLHQVDRRIPGDLRVIAGDLEGDSVVSWLKTLLSDAFYWTDNDLVVQTRSMYGGSPRSTSATFVLDQGGKVSHFNYFSNERTAEAITNALIQEVPQGFRTIGPLSWAGESSTGVRAARRTKDDGRLASEKPAVFLLPGILGSHLKVGSDRVWLAWRIVNGLERLSYSSPGVQPDGPIGLYYSDLADYLAGTHEVIEFAYDWRRPLEEEAQRLALAVEAALTARHKSAQPVRILAHSMGGLLARTFQLERPEVWKRMMAHPQARVLMLGTPNAGSWAPMQVLSGDDTFGNTLSMVGAPFQENQAREVMAGFPGFLQLQAGLLDEKLGLARSQTWSQRAKEDLEQIRRKSLWHKVELQLKGFEWGIPTQDVLDRAVNLRKRLDAQLTDGFDSFKDRLLLVVGRAPFTPEGFEIGTDGLVYLNAPEAGDGRVTLQSARLPGVRTWTLDCEHGSLPSRESAFDAYLDLLQTGRTARLPELGAAVSRAATAAAASFPVRSRPSRTHVVLRPPTGQDDLLTVGGGQPQERATRRSALQVTVVNGDLTFIRQPLLLGHYRSLRLTGTERVVDRLIGYAMSDALQLGLYPEEPGTHQIFTNTNTAPDNPWRTPRPEAVVVVGLGEEGKLESLDLVRTVRQAVLAWAQRVAEREDGPVLFELAATLIGSGGSGITVGQAAQLVAQGVREADEVLDEFREGTGKDGAQARLRWPRVGHLRLIELYLDRATEAWRALQLQAAAAPDRYQLTATVESGTGALRRPLDSGYRGAEYDFISALTADGPAGEGRIEYTLDTKRARSEVRGHVTQIRLVRDLIGDESNDQYPDHKIGQTLFRLLVPGEMEPFLAGNTDVQLELDRGTAGIPWELLDTKVRGSRDNRPWAIRTKLLRKFRTERYRPQPADADPDSAVLVIGEPECDPQNYGRLPGARREARSVVNRLTGPGGIARENVIDLISPDTPLLVGPNARTVINTLLSREWRIIHIAGHGEPPEMDGDEVYGDPRGVVLSNGTFLGPRELESLRTVPELVFVNCCHLALRSPGNLFKPANPGLGQVYDRARFAASVAERLIELGVRCVIAAGWAVEDGPADEFATVFYDSLLQGARFIDAVARAREAAYAHGGNTWAAYQCYGDPDWTFLASGVDPQRPATSPVDEFAGVASPAGLVLALDTLTVRSSFQNAPAEEQSEKLRYLEARFGSYWPQDGKVAEAFGHAWAAAGKRQKAVEWFDKALAADDGGASVRAAEQRTHLRVRMAWDEVDRARRRRDPLSRTAASPQPTGKTEAARDLEDAEQSLAAAIGEAVRIINEAIIQLEKLVTLQPSMERWNLLGSAYKRLAMTAAIAGRQDEETRALMAMREHYEKAERLGQKSGLPNLFYPGMQLLAAEILTSAAPDGQVTLDDNVVEGIRRSLKTKLDDDPDFWSVVGEPELHMYEAVSRLELAKSLPAILREYEDLNTRLVDAHKWSSVYDQADFVLAKYSKRVTDKKEQEAVDHLLSRLRSYAGLEPDTQPSPPTIRAARRGRDGAPRRR